MSENFERDQLLNMFIFETAQLIEQLEQNIIAMEKESCYTKAVLDEIFRIMHTIKGSAAIMLLTGISSLAHSLEDLFYYIREENPVKIDFLGLTDLVLESIDFIKIEMEKLKNEDITDEKPEMLNHKINEFLIMLKNLNSYSNVHILKKKSEINQMDSFEQCQISSFEKVNTYKAVIFFEKDCEMENIRALSVIRDLEAFSEELHYAPEDIFDNDDTAEIIRSEGFTVYIRSRCTYEKLNELLSQTVCLKDLDFNYLNDDEEFKDEKGKIDDQNLINAKFDILGKNIKDGANEKHVPNTAAQNSVINVSIKKLDKLMDLVGELVISEAMVTQNPDLKGLELDNFHKASGQLHKITGELQDIVMSIRMVPLASTFLKMNRLARDMSKKLNKEVELEIIGEDTEVDKNIIENISDPLMHLIRNCIDHGIETPGERHKKGKFEPAKITLEAKNSGGEVLVIVKDNGKGLNKDKIMEKALKNGIIHDQGYEITDKEIYSLIFIPGFSTNDSVTEYSGRGVGMDVVVKNIGSIGGTVLVDSVPGKGTIFTLKIPLTLAIIGGMNIRVGNSRYTIPTTSIKESFRARDQDIITDSDMNEMIMIRGGCYSILRLHERYSVKNSVTKISDGIIIMVENDSKILCIFADELLGEQQIVVKALPKYIENVRGIAGCTLLGDGSISLILDIAAFLNIK